MQIHFSFPDGLVMFITNSAIPRHGEIIDVSQINRPDLFESENEYNKFVKTLKLKVWKVNAVSYRLTSDEKSAAIIELIEKEDSQTYSAP
jgi:hypothetical protein